VPQPSLATASQPAGRTEIKTSANSKPFDMYYQKEFKLMLEGLQAT
jgi:hypothetical protein